MRVLRLQGVDQWQVRRPFVPEVLDTRHGCLGRDPASMRFLLRGDTTVDAHTKSADEQRQRKALPNERCQDHEEGQEDQQIAGGYVLRQGEGSRQRYYPTHTCPAYDERRSPTWRRLNRVGIMWGTKPKRQARAQ